MYIEFRFGPRDGIRRFLPLGRHSDTILLHVDGVDYLYRQTERYNEDGYRIYQFVAIVSDLVGAA